jgi:hypothetical protein
VTYNSVIIVNQVPLVFNGINLSIEAGASAAGIAVTATNSGTFTVIVYNATYVLFTQTNVPTPAASGKPIRTNQFDPLGVFQYTNMFNSSEQERYSLLLEQFRDAHRSALDMTERGSNRFDPIPLPREIVLLLRAGSAVI